MNRRTMLGALLGLGGSSLHWNPADSKNADWITETTAIFRTDVVVHRGATLEEVTRDVGQFVESALREDWDRRPMNIR